MPAAVVIRITHAALLKVLAGEEDAWRKADVEGDTELAAVIARLAANLRWDIEEDSQQRFPARIKIQSVNEPGSLAQVTQVIADHDGNIDNIRMTRRAPDFTELEIDLEVYDLKHLNAIIAQLKAKKVVAQVERVSE